MKKLKELYQQSLQELCHTKTVVLCGLLAALAIVLSMVASIQLGPYIKIGFSGLPNRIVEFLFGPAVGCLFGGALDLLKYVLKPDGPFFFGFTFMLLRGPGVYTLPYTILHKHHVFTSAAVSVQTWKEWSERGHKDDDQAS